MEHLQTRYAADMERLRTRYTCRHGSPQTWTARRSVPTSEVIGLHPRFLLQTQPYPRASEVGRFLRKRQRKGTWNVCRHATPADMERLLTRYICRHGTLQSRTARRSVPTSEVIGLGASSGYIPGSFDKLSLTRPPASPARHGFLEPRGSGASLSFPVRPSQRRRVRPNALRLRSTRRREARHDRWGNPRP